MLVSLTATGVQWVVGHLTSGCDENQSELSTFIYWEGCTIDKIIIIQFIRSIIIIRDGEQRSFAYFSSDWKYRCK